jgi:uncharacterized protein (TIGR02145 family)
MHTVFKAAQPRKYLLLTGSAILSVILLTCNPVDQELQVKIETGSVTEIGHTSCVLQGKIVDAGNGKIEQHGFCYSTSEEPTVFNQNTQLGKRTTAGDFSDTITELQSGTKYFFRAYAQSEDEIQYGSQSSFTTLSPVSPVVVLVTVGQVENDSVEITSEVTDDGGSEVISRGVCWSLGENPTVEDDHTADGSGMGSFTSVITNLMHDTVYHIRAYATSAIGTAYSGQQQVTTLPGGVVISTAEVTGVTKTGAVTGGHISDDGGSAITARGVCWNSVEHPTVEDNTTNEGSGTGTFTSSLSGLTPGTAYYLRAYATNSTGTYYGQEISFTTTSQSASLPVVTTAEVTGITRNSAEGGGEITDDGGSSVSARGVCWGISHEPDLGDGFTVDGSGTGMFSSAISGLDPNTTYYVRAYATNSEGTSYGPERSFITDQALYPPTLTTTAATSITENSAVIGGNITDDGGSPVTARGVCWGTSHNPDLTEDHTSDGTGTGSFSSTLTGLSPNTTYYARAYATNETGTFFGSEVSFTTDPSVFLPTLTTAIATSITENTAVSGGNITDDGGSPVSARGVCWSTSPVPEISDNQTADGTGTGSFTSSITGLSPNTTYYVRAYATTGEGTAYGNEVNFTTLNTPSLPTLTTTNVSNIATNSAKSGGNITSDGGSTILARGVCWSISQSPDLGGDYTTEGGGTGSFTSTMTGLTPNTTYYVRAYATNGTGTAYGNEVNFTTHDMGETVTDIDGNVYVTVVIGTQTWMAENLNVTHYANGDPIPQVTNLLDWAGASTGAYCYYDNNITHRETYGALYNGYAVIESRKICPAGWHVPSYSEWSTLVDFAGGSTVAGAKLKEEGGLHWPSYSLGTNEFGFTALPGGKRSSDGGFSFIGGDAYFYTGLRINSYFIYMWLYPSSYGVQDISSGGADGCSVRCIKD